MPRKPTINRIGRKAESHINVHEDAGLYLSYGYVLDGMKEPTLTEAKRLWKKHKEQICLIFCNERPGELPWAWWAFDAPDANRRGPYGALGETQRPGERWPSRESQYEYLERKGLLKEVQRLGYVLPKPRVEPD